MSQTIPQTLPLIVPILQALIALGLLNVWLVRSKQSTAYRGGSAKTLSDEFAVYGLPKWFMYAVGFLKIAIAVIMIAAVIAPGFVVTAALPNMLGIAVYAAALLVLLMLGAIAMHIKVRDGLIKMLPAIGMLAMAVGVIYFLVG